MTTPFLALAASGLAAIALGGCVIVNPPPTASEPRADLPEWRQPASQPRDDQSPRSGESCSGSSKSAQEIFSAARDGVAVVLTGDGQGSAFVVSQADGRTRLLTNSHVVEGDDRVELVWSDGSRDQATVIADAGGNGPDADMALLEVGGIHGTPLALAAELPQVGQSVFSIGAPKGLEFSLSQGVVSQLRGEGNLVQTDAAINSGNSGGPLLDDRGCVVGMATFIIRDSQGLNFAISRKVIAPFLAAPPSPPPIAQSPQATCFFQSYKTGQGEEIGCSLSRRENSNGHTVYEVAWADGYSSSYVFLDNGKVEIHAQGAPGEPNTHMGEFEQFRDGVAIKSNEGSITYLPSLDLGEN
jgi:S1-C subfamily serine protease